MNGNLREQLRGLVVFAPEVGEALRQGRAVVALESTVIAHGLPRPANLEVAASMERIVREGRAVPATIAILDGRVHYGLSGEELERVGTAGDIHKASLRDLPLLLASKASGATTVSATAHLAALAGIKVFATGGVGGVHRNWESTLDISADLPALASTPVVTVCAGAKSVLDLPATLEWLETHGVPVLGYRTGTFPAFYTRTTNPPLRVDLSVETAEEVAAIFNMRQRLNLVGGVLVCQPLPEAEALDNQEIEDAIESALRDARSQGIKGREVTPYLLGNLARTTSGRSLTANRLLLENNARLAAEISRALNPQQYV
ncbi:MAG TPA: pseudouridine-5'-phosphate glycosidase [Chloroflexia bacterium]|nr:pseudouridine-5'-phosphate glycosidase [Chloroflexia bacterium]